MALLFSLLLVPSQDPSWTQTRDHCRDLVRALKDVGSPLPEETLRGLQALWGKDPEDPELARAALEKLLDPHCLVLVEINPESRVKAIRGAAPAALRQSQPTFVLVKVRNEGGVTHPLSVDGPQLLGTDGPGAGRWLEATVQSPPPLRRKLSGRCLEYVLLRLSPREAGKREATLRFDVGQGTQDLGFRAEVSILFTIKGR